MSRTHFITYETLLEDPENQIMGFVHVGDFQGVTTSHIACWNPTDFLRIMKWGEQSVPMRHKEIHFCNIPSPIKWVIDVGKTRVSNKIKDRLHVSVSVSRASSSELQLTILILSQIALRHTPGYVQKGRPIVLTERVGGQNSNG